ncbi:MAG: hypothetical protein J0I19_13550 [Alphaproteobacteria bacterium]|nr:hypothetical protein [Alphaproteobacteria bacterium]
MDSVTAMGFVIAMFVGALLWSPMIGCMAVAVHARSRPLRLASRIFAALALLMVMLMASIVFLPD